MERLLEIEKVSDTERLNLKFHMHATDAYTPRWEVTTVMESQPEPGQEQGRLLTNPSDTNTYGEFHCASVVLVSSESRVANTCGKGEMSL